MPLRLRPLRLLRARSSAEELAWALGAPPAAEAALPPPGGASSDLSELERSLLGGVSTPAPAVPSAPHIVAGNLELIADMD